MSVPYPLHFNVGCILPLSQGPLLRGLLALVSACLLWKNTSPVMPLGCQCAARWGGVGEKGNKASLLHGSPTETCGLGTWWGPGLSAWQRGSVSHPRPIFWHGKKLGQAALCCSFLLLLSGGLEKEQSGAREPPHHDGTSTTCWLEFQGCQAMFAWQGLPFPPL